MNARDILNYGHQTLLSALEGISNEDAETGFVTQKWNVRDLVGHLAAHEHVLEEVIATQMLNTNAEESHYLRQYQDMPGEEFNQFHYEERKFSPYPDVLSELNSSHKHIIDSFYLVTEKMLKETGTLPWYGSQYSLEDFIVYANYGHKREHAAQIVQFKRKLNEQKHQPSKPSG